MDLSEQNVLLFSRSTQHGGTENVIFQICKILLPVANKVIVCSADGYRIDLLRKIGVKHYIIPDIEEKSPKTIMKVLSVVSNIIKNEKITIIHTHHRMAAFYTVLLSIKYRFCFMNTSHNTFFNKKFLTKIAYKKANLIACGEMVKKNLIDIYGINEKRVTVIHNSVEPFTDKIVADKLLLDLRNQGNILVANIGRLSKQKGMEYFIQSYPYVKNRNNHVKFIIVGDGEDRKKLESMVKENNDENNFYFLGYRNDIRNVMSQVDFIVLSSLWEGLPLTPIEAFSVKKTVIGTAVDGTVEIIEDSDNGYLIEPGNSKRIAEKIIELIDNTKLRKTFEEKAYRRFEEEFSFHVYRERIIQYYYDHC